MVRRLAVNPAGAKSPIGFAAVGHDESRALSHHGFLKQALLFLFFYWAFGVGEDFFRYGLRDYVVVVHFHVVTAFALSHGS